MAKIHKTKCQICGKEFETEGSGAAGALALHLYKTHGIKKQDNSSKEKEGGCDTKWRFLNPSDPQEQKAVDAGYTMISDIAGKSKLEQILK
ncbi:MAG: hypothetical protein N4A68_07495 [Maledivibacter sp.]|jgi:hypothetical protein|nr:hypothetical protein [Maledivibacter sp.]